ncbi:MAG: nuclease-related domain-containing protein, partial [Pedococcus sp.]
MGNPGQSADEQAKRLRDEAGKWAAGAEGERRVAAALSSLPTGWTVVHDRLLRPGRSEANLDHIVIGPTGVYLVDAKNRAGRVTEHEGGLFQHRHRDGRPESVSLAAELKKVHGMAAYMAAEADRPITPVLCLAGAHADEFGEPRMVRGVWVVPVAALPGWLRARPVV